MTAHRSTYRKADAALKRLTMTEFRKQLTGMVIGDGGQILLCMSDRKVPMARVTVETFDLPAPT